MEEKMSKRRFTILLVLLYVVLFILFKLFLVYSQDLFMDHSVYDRSYSFGNVLTIKSQPLPKEETFTSQSNQYRIKVKNYFSGFELEEMEDQHETYTLYGEDDFIQAVFMMGIYPTQITNIHDDSIDSIYYEFNRFPLYISDILSNHFFHKYEIHNDVDLIKFLRERKKEKCGFFTPISKIKENYFFNFIELQYPSLDKITYLEGDVEGYLLEEDNYKRVFILKNNQLYYFVFYQLDYFTNEVIEDILSSLVIEK